MLDNFSSHQIMSDAEIHHFVKGTDELAKFALDESVFLECGKVKALVALLDRCKAEGKRMLLFSQFTMILDILEVALNHINVRFIRLDGATRTDERQSLVDEFNDDQDITVFLLSTKAGGVGINLTAASVVVIFDQDFNPHNDRQAADRAYRIVSRPPSPHLPFRPHVSLPCSGSCSYIVASVSCVQVANIANNRAKNARSK